MAGENKELTGITMEVKKVVLCILLAVGLVLFMLGYLSRGKKEETISFTYEEIQIIEKFQQQMKTDDPKGDVIVYKDKKGNLMLGWEE